METIRALRLPQVSAMTGLARSTIYALVAKGEFPSPFKLSPGTSAWLESDVQTWLRGRVEASRAAGAEAEAEAGAEAEAEAEAEEGGG